MALEMGAMCSMLRTRDRLQILSQTSRKKTTLFYCEDRAAGFSETSVNFDQKTKQDVLSFGNVIFKE
jgi:hypothetical protein